MIILDTDHWSSLKYRDNPASQRLMSRMDASLDQDFVISAITLEEQMRGWLSQINTMLDVTRQVDPYRHLIELVRFFSAWKILPFDLAAARQTVALRKAKIRIGTMDLKIAALAISQEVLLLNANARDFGQVPGLRFENWLY